MQPFAQCCRPASTTAPEPMSDDPFAQMIVLDYYDGPAGGLLKCKVCAAEYYFFLLDWDETHSVRVFALAPIAESSFADLFSLFQAIPDRRVWIPPWPSEERRLDFYEKGIGDLIDRAGAPTVAIGWSVEAEKTLAMRSVDSSLAPHLSPWFDRQPYADRFDWFGYLGLVKSLQV